MIISKQRKVYSYIKLTLKEILISNSYPIQLRFAAYYFKLIYKQFIIQTTARIEINKKKSIVDVYCIFLFLHSELFAQIKGLELFKTILCKLKEKNPSQQIKNSVYNSHSKLNGYLKIDAINYEEIKRNNSALSTKFFDIIKDSFKAIKDKYYIHFIEVPIQETSSLEEQCFINSKVIEIEKDNTKSFYTMQGLFFFGRNEEINLFLYEQLSQRWYSIKEKRWMIDLILPKDMSSITLVYFR